MTSYNNASFRYVLAAFRSHTSSMLPSESLTCCPNLHKFLLEIGVRETHLSAACDRNLRLHTFKYAPVKAARLLRKSASFSAVNPLKLAHLRAARKSAPRSRATSTLPSEPLTCCPNLHKFLLLLFWKKAGKKLLSLGNVWSAHFKASHSGRGGGVSRRRGRLYPKIA